MKTLNSRTVSPAPADLQSTLLHWYDANARILPWRSPPGTMNDPYRVWLSEIMLQQTTVATVKGYFETFVRRWPTVMDLAAAELDDVLAAWAGLGYYARARNLHKCARLVAGEFGGKFPSKPDALQKLPGIGPYTAGAIAAIAFDHPAVAVDGNIERVIARLFAVETPLPEAKPEITGIATRLVPATRAGDYTQAMMDLGATICAPRRANCLICPLQAICRGHAMGIAETLPRKKPKTAKPTRQGFAYVIENADGCIFLQRRPDRGLLGGMMSVPATLWDKCGGSEEDDPPVAGNWVRVHGSVQHTFTHFHLSLTVKKLRTDRQPKINLSNGRWVSRALLADEALPTVMKKVLAHALGNETLTPGN